MSRLLHTSLVAGSGPDVKVVDGRGVRLHLADGRDMLDGSNTGGPLGHRHPAMVEACRRAADLPVINEGWYWVEREKAAEDLFDIAFAGEDWAGAVRFCLSASEANDLAMSFAQAYTGREAFATRERAYHGIAGLSRSLTVQPQWHGGLAVLEQPSRPAPSPFPVRQLPPPLGARYGETPNASVAERLAGATELLSDVSATVIDYTQGGYYYDAEYQDTVARACREAGSLWVADETVTGIGRFGRSAFTFQGGAERPDIVVLGKGLAGGSSPIGAVVFSKALVENLKGKSWRTYSTLRGHPYTMACVRAYLATYREEKVLEHVAAMERVVDQRMAEIYAKHPSILRIDGNGLHWTVEMHGPDWRLYEMNTAEVPLATKVVHRAMEAGTMFATSGEQSSVFLAPPLIVSEGELNQMLDALDHGLAIADQFHDAA